jgi:hypothetical protein
VAYLSFTNVAIDEATSRAREAGLGARLGAPNIVSTIDGFFKRYIFDPFISAYADGLVPEVRIVEESSPLPREIQNDAALSTRVNGVTFPLKSWEFKAIWTRDAGLEYRRKVRFNNWAHVQTGDVRGLEEAKRRSLMKGYVTYNDIILWCWKVLEQLDLRAAEIVAARFGEIIVDEAQDTSALQQRILVALEAAGTHVAYIGDPLQCIYQFNDANPHYLAELKATRDPWELTINYRSSDRIVDVINAHFGTKMTADRVSTDAALGALTFVGSPDAAITAFEQRLLATGIDPADSAVVVRTNDHLRDLTGAARTDDLAPSIRFAIQAWQAERSGNFVGAAGLALSFLRSVAVGVGAGRAERAKWKPIAWSYVREWFPEPGDESCSDWVDRLRTSVLQFATHASLTLTPNQNTILAKRGLPPGTAGQFLVRELPNTRASTIHGVKGESIGAILLAGDARSHESWLSLTDDEETAVLYVALTRAKELILLACPTPDIAAAWARRGFRAL